MIRFWPHLSSSARLASVCAILFCLAGCPRNQTTLDDRTLSDKSHVETEHPVDRSDPFRP